MPEAKPLTFDDIQDSREVVISETQAKDHSIYTRMRSEALTRGRELRIVTDKEFSELTSDEPPAPQPKRTPAGIFTRSDGSRIYTVPASLIGQDASVYREHKAKAAAEGLELWITGDGASAT